MLTETDAKVLASEIFDNKYDIQEKIGEGGCSQVFKAYSNEAKTQPLALKLITHPGLAEEFKNETAVLAQLNRLIDANSTITTSPKTKEQQPFFGVVMDFVPGKPLNKYLEENPCISMHERMVINQNILHAIYDLHKQRVIHDDISPSNFMIDPETKKLILIDFGWSKIVPLDRRFSHGYKGRYWGWRWFTAPENLPYHGIPGKDCHTLTPIADAFATGETLKYTFGCLDRERFPLQPVKIKLDSGTLDLLTSMTATNPKDRMAIYNAKNEFDGLVKKTAVLERPCSKLSHSDSEIYFKYPSTTTTAISDDLLYPTSKSDISDEQTSSVTGTRRHVF